MSQGLNFRKQSDTSQLHYCPTQSTRTSTVFDKFKQSDSYQASSAFKLVKALNSETEGSVLNSLKQRKENQVSSDFSSGKRGQYRKYTFAEKNEAVKMIEEGKDAREISEKFCIPRRNLLRWKKNGCMRKQGGGRPTDNKLESLLYSKILKGDIKTEKEIRLEAKRISQIQNFKASKGWYSKFHRRFIAWSRKNVVDQQGKNILITLDSASEKSQFEKEDQSLEGQSFEGSDIQQSESKSKQLRKQTIKKISQNGQYLE